MKGRDVRRARRLLGMSQAKFAQELGISGQLVSNIETLPGKDVRRSTALAIECILRREGKLSQFKE